MPVMNSTSTTSLPTTTTTSTSTVSTSSATIMRSSSSSSSSSFSSMHSPPFYVSSSQQMFVGSDLYPPTFSTTSPSSDSSISLLSPFRPPPPAVAAGGGGSRRMRPTEPSVNYLSNMVGVVDVSATTTTVTNARGGGGGGSSRVDGGMYSDVNGKEMCSGSGSEGRRGIGLGVLDIGGGGGVHPPPSDLLSLQNTRTKQQHDERLKAQIAEHTVSLKYLEQWRFICVDFDKYRSKSLVNLKQRIRQGIPDCLRGSVWQKLAGSRDILEKSSSSSSSSSSSTSSSSDRSGGGGGGGNIEGMYARLRCQRKAPCEGDILRDISRTFPKHILFRDRASFGQESLFNVLRAYSLYNPSVGYCQGMGFVVGLLLMFMNEEDSFLMLIALLDKYKMDGLFRPGLPLLDRYFYQLQRLLRAHMPRLYEHLRRENVDATMYASQWFMTIFTYSFSFEVVVRIWDIFLLEGIKTVFRVALAILKLQQESLFHESFEAILHRLKSTPNTVEVEELLTSALNIKIRQRTLEELEREYEETSNSRRLV